MKKDNETQVLGDRNRVATQQAIERSHAPGPQFELFGQLAPSWQLIRISANCLIRTLANETPESRSQGQWQPGRATWQLTPTSLPPSSSSTRPLSWTLKCSSGTLWSTLEMLSGRHTLTQQPLSDTLMSATISIQFHRIDCDLNSQIRHHQFNCEYLVFGFGFSIWF